MEGPTVSTPVCKHALPQKRRPKPTVSPPRQGTQRELLENVMRRPVTDTDTVAETSRAPRLPQLTDRAERLDLVPSHLVDPYLKGHVLLGSLNHRLTSLKDRMAKSENVISLWLV